MDKKQIIILAVTIAFVGFRLYQKYIKKDKIDSGSATKKTPDSAFTSSSKDDDYEPYSKK
jgi:hypothetical protein